jgi:hypothetical protein
VPPVEREVRSKTVPFEDRPDGFLCFLSRGCAVRVEKNVSSIAADRDPSAELPAGFVLDLVGTEATGEPTGRRRVVERQGHAKVVRHPGRR